MNKILIVGGSGFLGSRLLELYRRDGFDVFGTYNSRENGIGLEPLDITRREDVFDLINRINPEIVIGTAAYPSPDKCELDKKTAEDINFFGIKNIVDACEQKRIRYDHISTAFVFSGGKGSPYNETDKTAPVNYYGETKLAAEQEVKRLETYSILRFDKLFGYNGKGKPNDVFSYLLEGNNFTVNGEQMRQFLFTDDIYRFLRIAQDKSLNGIYHLAGTEPLDRFEFTQRLARAIDREGLVKKAPEGKLIAKKPEGVVLDTTKAKSEGMKFTEINESLREIRERILETRQTVEGSYRRGAER